MRGKIIRGIAGFYYVLAEDSCVYECKAKGIFRKDRQKPLVGDLVETEVIDREEKTASITKLLPRKNELIRPAVANVDQAMVLFALKDPDPEGTILDRFLVMMEKAGVPVFICFNKKDLVDPASAEHWCGIYSSCGYEVFLLSADREDGTEAVRRKLLGKTTVVAGPSGSGKSTLTNCLQTIVRMETGGISRKLKRGRNTTRHAELIPMGQDTFFCDTPGFTSLDLPEIGSEELQRYFREFAPYEPQCRFPACSHIHEPDCGVKEALKNGQIRKERYENYCRFYEMLKEQEKRKY